MAKSDKLLEVMEHLKNAHATLADHLDTDEDEEDGGDEDIDDGDEDYSKEDNDSAMKKQTLLKKMEEKEDY